MGRPIITFKTTGKFVKTTAHLNRLKTLKILDILNQYGQRGVAALQAATPVDTGATAAAWYYTVGNRGTSYWIDFHNDHRGPGPVAILIQYGHATRNGGYVPGRDYINPAIRPIFDQIKDGVWEEVRKV